MSNHLTLQNFNETFSSFTLNNRKHNLTIQLIKIKVYHVTKKHKDLYPIKHFFITLHDDVFNENITFNDKGKWVLSNASVFKQLLADDNCNDLDILATLKEQLITYTRNFVKCNDTLINTLVTACNGKDLRISGRNMTIRRFHYNFKHKQLNSPDNDMYKGFQTLTTNFFK